MSEQNVLKSDLTLHWVVVSMMLIMIISYNVICLLLGDEIQIFIVEDQRILIRTILYIISIILFPLANLVRHIMLRLNHTMPGNRSAKSRYFITTLVTLMSIEIVGVFGLLMFVLGDDYNTLYIFSLLAVLGVFLHRPRMQEYRQIIEALALKNEE